MTTVRVALVPRDGWSGKDGRGWYTSDVGRSRSHLWPMPATLRGALRGAFGRARGAGAGFDWEKETEGVAVRKLCALCRRSGGRFVAADRRWPVPADAVHGAGGGVTRLVPKPGNRPPGAGTLGRGDDEAIEALWLPKPPGGKVAAGPAFWDDAEMIAWLHGGDAARRDPQDPARTPVVRDDIGLAIDPATRAALPSMLRSFQVTEGLGYDRSAARAWEWAVGVEVELPEGAPGLGIGPMFVGGRRRQTFVEELGTPVFDAPEGLGSASGKYLRVVLATPAELENGWLPGGFVVETVGNGRAFVGTLSGVSVVLRAAIRAPADRALDVGHGEARPSPDAPPRAGGQRLLLREALRRLHGRRGTRPLARAARRGRATRRARLDAAGRMEPRGSRNMKTVPYLLQAISPLHAGTGHAAGIIDLPIARMRATGIPFLPGSSIKESSATRGAPPRGPSPSRGRSTSPSSARAATRRSRARPATTPATSTMLVPWSSATPASSPSPSAASAGPSPSLPPPSSSASPTAILSVGGKASPSAPERIDGPKALVVRGSLNVRSGSTFYLEDLDLPATPNDKTADAWADAIASTLPEGERGSSPTASRLSTTRR